MKLIGPLLATSLTLIVLLSAGVIGLLPRLTAAPIETAPEKQALVTVQDSLALASKNTDWVQSLAERESVYVVQINQVNSWYQERQQLYQAQIQDLENAVVSAQTQISSLDQQEAELTTQFQQLQTMREERQIAYQQQLDQLSTDYQPRINQLQNRLAEAHARLAEANVQLRR